MKQSAELEQLLHWNESAEDFEKGEWARQQPWQQPWQTGYPLVLSCSLPPSRHYSCGSQVSLHFLLNRLCLPLSGGYLHNSNHSLCTVKFGHQHLTAQSQHTKWHGASVCHLEPEFLPFPHSANLQMRLQWQEGSPGVQWTCHVSEAIYSSICVQMGWRTSWTKLLSVMLTELLPGCLHWCSFDAAFFPSHICVCMVKTGHTHSKSFPKIK